MMKVLNDLEEITSTLGSRLVSSPWVTVDQATIDAFAETTGDKQWIHLDPARAARETPWGSTLAHGFLTLSLIPFLAEQSYRIEGFNSKLNYGLDRVRFIQPVLSGSRIRGHFTPMQVIDKQPGHLLDMQVEIEIEGQQQPACMARLLFLLVP
ncbi:MaoC family dehydratase [Marinospirillum sp.]|uniref:MaoC family dehydratase n=1 Tax=Marinospirillum sp. TaxID=2183934 RepID=UPI0028703F6A|nr:MaoC family dehydratase [Marinospirillum sp.]MDR9467889.1 MaoC family dehydratase [Marinospirillum sp.]